MRRNKSQKPYIPIQTLLAYNATDASVKLLKKYGYNPKGIEDIQVQISEAYKNAADKTEFEKELIAIHPHAKLFEKYLTKPEVKADKTVVEVSPENAAAKEVKNTIVHDGYSSCEGSQTCSCMRNLYNFDGTGAPKNDKENKQNDVVYMLGLVSIVAIFGLIIYKS